MKHLFLILANLRRRKLRTAFTVLSIAVAFLLFGLLSAIRVAFGLGIDLAGADRLLTLHKVSIIQPLPKSYQDQIARVPGVREVTHASWFGGYYKDKKNLLAMFPIELEPWLRMYPEFVLPDDQKRAFLADREGAVIGRDTAKRYGWKVGDRIPIFSPIWRRADGRGTWEFNVVIAAHVDELFGNSPAEKKTATEKVFVQSFAKQIGDIGLIITFVVVVVFFAMLLVVGNTIAQSVRERTAELAVLKTLGFSSPLVTALVLAESLLIAAVGGGIGLLATWLVVLRGDPTGGYLPAFYVPARYYALGVFLIFFLGLAAGFFPAWRALRLRIAEGLRQVV
ncbi:MAG: hypothetical protein DMF49_13045 [Acidobacteria bacterium]|nr:MAG: hypothetical protein DMF49_13045 [Acidobacteriota bacterium]